MIINFRTPMRSTVLPLAALCAGALAACSPPAGTQGSPDGGTFIAVSSDMNGYHSWQRYDAGSDVVDQVHSNGLRTDYINKVPHHGQTEFDIGTIVIKEVASEDGGPPQIFAMAKRGGGYNDGGALNREWFSLQDAGTGDNIEIVWRGEGPPQNDNYGASHEACNECHASLAGSNDFVASPPLQLSNF